MTGFLQLYMPFVVGAVVVPIMAVTSWIVPVVTIILGIPICYGLNRWLGTPSLEKQKKEILDLMDEIERRNGFHEEAKRARARNSRM